MDEKSFFDQGDVSVSNARFIVRGQTYAMSGVTSVKSFRQDPSRKAPIILGIIGVLIMVAGGNAVWVGLIVIAGAIALWISQKPEFSVVLSSSSGEARALTSKDEAYITNVVSALNNAIVHRG